MKRRHFLGYSLSLIAGCTAATSNSPETFSGLEAGSSAEMLRFTVTDVQDIEELKRDYEGLRTVLEEILAKTIEFVTVESYIAGAAALQSDQVDLVLTGPSEYVVIRARTNAVPVISITRPNYRSIICVSANSAIKSVAQLKGKKIAMWQVGSTSGHLGATSLLMDAGLDPKSDLKILMLGSQGLPALQNGEVDAWGGSSARYAEFLEEQDLSESALPPIVKGPLLPKDIFVANSKLATNFVEEIRLGIVKNHDKVIQSLSAVDRGKYKDSKLVLANDSDYEMIRDVYKAIGQGSFVH